MRREQGNGAALIEVLRQAFEGIEFCQTGSGDLPEFAGDALSVVIRPNHAGIISGLKQGVSGARSGFPDEFLCAEQVVIPAAAFERAVNEDVGHQLCG